MTKRNGWLTAGGVLIVIMIAAGGEKNGVGNSAAPTEAVAAAPAPAPLQVTADDLVKAYDANEAAAQQRFGDKQLLVTGKVASIDLDLTNDPVVVLASANQFVSPRAALSDASKPAAAGLSKGQTIRLVCTKVSEAMSIPMLSDCTIA